MAELNVEKDGGDFRWSAINAFIEHYPNRIQDFALLYDKKKDSMTIKFLY